MFQKKKKFFLISKKDVYSKNYFMQINTKHIKDYRRRDKTKTRGKKLITKKLRLRNKGKDSLDVSLQALDQSKRELVKEASN